MLLVDDILLFPVHSILWVFREISEIAQKELTGEATSITEQLRVLYMQLETGRITEAEFDAGEKVLLDRLDAIESRMKDEGETDDEDETEELDEDETEESGVVGRTTGKTQPPAPRLPRCISRRWPRTALCCWSPPTRPTLCATAWLDMCPPASCRSWNWTRSNA
jgi:hypothetical protein